MTSPNSPVLQKLNQLDKSLPGFRDQLLNILYGEEYVCSAPELEGDDPVWLVNYLDQVLDGLEPSCAASRKCLRELRNTCGSKRVLPSSYMLSSPLQDIGSDPFASGGYGEVYKATLNGAMVCVKRMKVYTRDPPEKAMKAFCQEAAMWKRLVHPNVMPLLGVTTSPWLQLVSDWMSCGDLLEYIRKHAGVDRVGLLIDVAEGLCYLHSCNVIHGDLKGANILVDNSGHGQITDFGLTMVTKNLDSIPSTTHHGHTPRWSAPEVLSEGIYTKEADIFSFAMVMVEAFTGEVPFKASSSFMAMLAITQGKRPPRPRHPVFTEKLWLLMQHCWEHDPQSRPEASETLQILLTPDIPAWEQLTTQTLTTEEHLSLIEAIFSDHDQITMVKNLNRVDAQAFIDVIYQVLDHLPSQILKLCLPTIYSICDHQALVPQSLEIPLCYNPTENPVSQEDFMDVWKGQHNGKEVAVKVLRVYSTSDLTKVRSRFCRGVATWKALSHPNVLPVIGVTITENQFAIVLEWMGNGNVNEFIVANPTANRLKLLRDVANGLIYVHDLGIAHGNLKGANILIGHDGHACLSDYTMLTTASDRQPTVSQIEGGTVRWMSPELLSPESFGLKDSHPTKESDYYALGMVIYEVLSGQAPFAPFRVVVVMQKVLGGAYPSRPQGAEGVWFTDELWEMLELCWNPHPSNRPGLDIVLQHLQDAMDLPTPISQQDTYGSKIESGTLGATPRNNKPLASPAGSPPNSGLPQPRNPRKEGFVERLVLGAHQFSKTAARKLHQFQQAK